MLKIVIHRFSSVYSFSPFKGKPKLWFLFSPIFQNLLLFFFMYTSSIYVVSRGTPGDPVYQEFYNRREIIPGVYFC